MPRAKLQHRGKFWPRVRAMIWEKAEELFMAEQAKTMDFYNKPEKCELLEGGYFHEAKLIVLRNLWREKKACPKPTKLFRSKLKPFAKTSKPSSEEASQQS